MNHIQPMQQMQRPSQCDSAKTHDASYQGWHASWAGCNWQHAASALNVSVCTALQAATLSKHAMHPTPDNVQLLHGNKLARSHAAHQQQARQGTHR